MKEYFVLQENNLSDLARRVNSYLSEGCKLQGGACISRTEGHKEAYCQAMIDCKPC